MGNIIQAPQKLLSFLKDVRLEMKKVNWPTRAQTTKFTVIVVLASGAVSLYLGLLDYIFNWLLDAFII